MRKPHIARILVEGFTPPANPKAKGCYMWAVWETKQHFLAGMPPYNYSPHMACIRTTVRDLPACKPREIVSEFRKHLQESREMVATKCQYQYKGY